MNHSVKYSPPYQLVLNSVQAFEKAICVLP